MCAHLSTKAGKLLQMKARKAYVVAENQTLPLVDDEGQLLFERHPANDRNQSDTIDRYMATIEREGLLQRERTWQDHHNKDRPDFDP